MARSRSENVIKYEPQDRINMGTRGQAQQGTTKRDVEKNRCKREGTVRVQYLERSGNGCKRLV